MTSGLDSAAGRPAALVKVCGLTRREDAGLAAELGAWAVGFVLAPSPRRVTVEQARSLAAAARAAEGRRSPRSPVLTVGVFVDASVEEIARAVETVPLDAVQLHGPKPGAAAVRAVLGSLVPEVLIIQAVAVPVADVAVSELQTAVAAACGQADLLLFDTRVGGQAGGTGMPFRWELARDVAAGVPFLVAGGIDPSNAGRALAASGAAGVDVSSGVEVSPGVKDETLLRALFAGLVGGTLILGGGRTAPVGSAREPLEGRGL